jgi:hypothetical protein
MKMPFMPDDNVSGNILGGEVPKEEVNREEKKQVEVFRTENV